jgi:hypothetical protein
MHGTAPPLPAGKTRCISNQALENRFASPIFGIEAGSGEHEPTQPDLVLKMNRKGERHDVSIDVSS